LGNTIQLQEGSSWPEEDEDEEEEERSSQRKYT
jgi:hypothetical protein